MAGRWRIETALAADTRSEGKGDYGYDCRGVRKQKLAYSQYRRQKL